VANLQYEREISLPIYPDLTDADVDYVVERLRGSCGPDSRRGYGQLSAGAGLPYQVLSWPNSVIDSAATLC